MKPSGERPTVEGPGPENFVPWEQIEPLIAAGYDDAEKLGREILTRAGFPTRGYRLELIGPPPFHEALRRGVYINKIGPDNWWKESPPDSAPCNPDAEGPRMPPCDSRPNEKSGTRSTVT